MRISFSITLKLLLFVLPLVCIPIAIVGYLSYKTSVESVTRLSRDKQMLQAKAAATEINTIFQFCCRDLETMAGFLLDDTQFGATLKLDTNKQDSHEKILKLFRDFKSRSFYHLYIRLSDALGREITIPELEGQSKRISIQAHEAFTRESVDNGKESCRVSMITYSELHQSFIER